jgi:23S rRNA (uridine2552-2'-O)-methyltransferase
VVGADLSAVEVDLRLANVFSFVGDVANPATSHEIRSRLGGAADVVLSDAAPELTGVRATDRAREEGLLAAIEARVGELLRPGGTCLVKLLDCPESDLFRARLARRFESSRTLRPRATRKGSAERYLLLRGFLG